jgi:VIT1/CCC1 family predicted Fe2+/Mn2+ transporter
MDLADTFHTMTPKSYWIHTVTSSGELGTVDRINEILFGLIMVLTFTCSISAATAGREELSTVLWSALGCNIAWGFVDAMMYLFSVLLERGEMFANVRRIRNANTEIKRNEAVKETLHPLLSQMLKDDHIVHLSNEIKNLPEPPVKVFLTWHDLRNAAMIFLMVFLSTFPVTIPFIFIREVHIAMRVSNGIALVSLFLTGVYLAKQTGHRRVFAGFVFATIGMILVSVTIALGG